MPCPHRGCTSAAPSRASPHRRAAPPCSPPPPAAPRPPPGRAASRAPPNAPPESIANSPKKLCFFLRCFRGFGRLTRLSWGEEAPASYAHPPNTLANCIHANGLLLLILVGVVKDSLFPKRTKMGLFMLDFAQMYRQHFLLTASDFLKTKRHSNGSPKSKFQYSILS